MIKALIILALFIVGIWAGPYLIHQQGYVLIALGNWTLETSVVVFVIATLVLWFVIKALIWLIRKVFKFGKGSWSFFDERKQRKQHQAFLKGLVALDEADFLQAKKHLEFAAQADKVSGVEYLAAAQAALGSGDQAQAKAYWHKASECKQTELAAKLNLIRDAVANRQFQQGLNLLDGLSQDYQDHPTVVALKAECLAGLGRWQVLRENLKAWKKPLGIAAYDKWMRAATSGIFSEIASKEGANALKERWSQLPRSARKDTAQQAAYVRQLIGQGMYKDAEQALVGFLSYPDPAMLPLFKQLKLSQPTAALKQLEQWLKKDENNIEILSALGHLAYNAAEYRLADKVITKRLALAHDQEDAQLLAAIKEALQQPGEALLIYKQLGAPAEPNNER